MYSGNVPSSTGGVIHFDNAPHTRTCLWTAGQSEVCFHYHPPYLPDLYPWDLFCSWKWRSIWKGTGVMTWNLWKLLRSSPLDDIKVQTVWKRLVKWIFRGGSVRFFENLSNTFLVLDVTKCIKAITFYRKLLMVVDLGVITMNQNSNVTVCSEASIDLI